MSFVYLLTNLTNNKVYVGKTVRTVEERWREHRTRNYDKHNKYPISRAIKKNTPELFDVQVLAENVSEDSASNLEKVWIILLRATDPKYGYNIRYGGEGQPMSDETKEKLSELHSGPNSSRYKKEVDKDIELLKELRLSGKGKRNISKLTGYAATTISRRLKKLGVETPKPLEHVSNEEIARLYKTGLSARDIAVQLGIKSKTTISNRLKRMGIERNPPHRPLGSKNR